MLSKHRTSDTKKHKSTAVSKVKMAAGLSSSKRRAAALNKSETLWYTPVVMFSLRFPKYTPQLNENVSGVATPDGSHAE